MTDTEENPRLLLLPIGARGDFFQSQSGLKPMHLFDWEKPCCQCLFFPRVGLIKFILSYLEPSSFDKTAAAAASVLFPLAAVATLIAASCLSPLSFSRALRGSWQQFLPGFKTTKRNMIGCGILRPSDKAVSWPGGWARVQVWNCSDRAAG